MPTAVIAEWRAQKVAGRQVQICHGDLCSKLSYDEANEFALQILGVTKWEGIVGPSSASKVAAPKPSTAGASSKKGGKKGGKNC